MKLGDAANSQRNDLFGLSLDLVLGVGSFPKGRIVVVFGPESSGKTTLSLHAV